MTKLRIVALGTKALLLGSCLVGGAKAELLDRGNGFIYDTDLNITWLQDANFAKTTEFNSNSMYGPYTVGGRMHPGLPELFVSTLSVHGITGWRLPSVNPLGPPDCYNPRDGFVPCKPYGSELGHLFSITLGNLEVYDFSNNGQHRPGVSGVDYGWVNTGPFINVLDQLQTPFAIGGGNVLGYPLWFYDGYTTYFSGSNAEFLLAWAVHDGDIAPVPEPRSWLLLGAGLAAASIWRTSVARRQKSSS